MSSFVSTVLKHADQLERKSLCEKMDILTQKCYDLELEVHQFVESKFVQFHPSLSAAEVLHQNVVDVKNNIDEIGSKINSEIKDQLTSSTGEFQRLSIELAEAKVKTEGLDYLTSLFNLYQASTKALHDKKYCDAIVALNEFDDIIKKPMCEGDDAIHIKASMKLASSVQRVTIKESFSDAWAECVKWNVQRDKTSSADDSSVVTEVSVTVSSSELGAASFTQLVKALDMSNMLTLRMKTFASHFQSHIIPFLTEPSGTIIELESTDTAQILVLKRSQPEVKGGKGNKTKSKEKVIPDSELYAAVFKNVQTALEHLHTILLHVDYGWQDMSAMSSESDVSVAPTGSSQGILMNLLGLETSPWLLDFLQRDVIAKAVPTSANDLAGFERVTAATVSLHEKLVSLGFISSENTALLKSVENVHLLFSNKKFLLILEEARNLMTSDLMNETVAIVDGKPMGDWPMLSSNSTTNKKGRKIESLVDNLLSDNTFKIADCRISHNIQLLVSMAYEVLLEATSSSEECAIQMYYAVHNIFELFCHVVETHHGKNIETFPQMAALHHNNCMFIAHHLMTLGHQFATKLPFPGVPTFVDLIQQIRTSGVTLFLQQVTRQEVAILESLDGADGFGNVEEEANKGKAERAIKQALLQLQHLQKVWQTVLPVNVYRRSMGKLLQSVVKRMTDCISSLEDIAQDAARNLTALLEPVEKEAANLMALTPAELIRHVHNWSRLKDTTTVLNASLLNIGDLWSEGKGPLALTFSPTEMKTLIRALFQNTDRRAAILATIK